MMRVGCEDARRSLRRCLACLVGVLLLTGPGCSYGISVRRASGPDVLETWRVNVGEDDSLSPRTLQTLRRWDVEDQYQRHPLHAYSRLQVAAAREAEPDLLFALAELSYHLGRKAEKRDCTHASGYYYLCAGYAYHYLFPNATDPNHSDHDTEPKSFDAFAFDPRFRLACDLYNTGLAKCIVAAQKIGRLDPRQQLQLPTPDTKGFRLSVVHHGFPWQPEEFGPLLLCADYEVIGLANHYRGYGLGVALIGTRDPQMQERDLTLARAEARQRKFRANQSEDDSEAKPTQQPSSAEEALPPPRLLPGRRAGRYPREVSFPVSAFFRFDGRVADLGTQRSGRLELYNPLTVQTVRVAGKTVPLQADLTTPLAYFLSRTDLDGIEYTGFLHADKIQDQAGIYMFEPYQPGKIPVVMVHGLLSSPLTWTTLFNDLRADPRLRERYQFWFYLYPTGNPYLAAAADLRQELDQLRRELDPQGRDAAFDHLVLVGHSMGGLVAKLLTVESRNDFWQMVSPRSFDSLKVSPDTRAELRRLFYFGQTSSVQRVIFLATPHHGSKLGPSPPARLAARFIRMPKRLMKVVGDVALADPQALPRLRDGQIASSLDLLAPGAPALELLAARPIPPRVHFHSIVGEAFGEGASGSDGVVPYSSAHLEGVDSEIVVPAHHLAVHHHPRTILEVRRILEEHLRDSKLEEGIYVDFKSKAD